MAMLNGQVLFMPLALSSSRTGRAVVVGQNRDSKQIGFFVADTNKRTPIIRQLTEIKVRVTREGIGQFAVATSPAGEFVAIAGNADDQIEIYRVQNGGLQQLRSLTSQGQDVLEVNSTGNKPPKPNPTTNPMKNPPWVWV